MLPAELTVPARTIGALLRERGETVAVAEGSAGGLISAALLSVPGAHRRTTWAALWCTPGRRAWPGCSGAIETPHKHARCHRGVRPVPGPVVPR